MRVLFVFSDQDPFSEEKPLETWERMQFGISYISAFLKCAGHETRLVVPTRRTKGAVLEHIKDFEPGLICFTGVYSEIPFLSEVASMIKKRHPCVFLLLGGPHATLNPLECLEAPFDAVCVGEGEYPALELADALEEGRAPSGIKNLYIKRGGGIEKNETRPFIPDLDSLPFPDREMWEPWIHNLSSRPSVLAGRGCPFKCTYCSNHALAKVSPGRYVRLRSPENIIAELREMKRKRPDLVEVYLEVETLGVDRSWAHELCARLKDFNVEQDIPVAFGSNLRVTPNARYDSLFKDFRECGFRFINVGLESGSKAIRDEVLNRRYSNADVIRTVKSARANGLQVGMYNLIGIPGETKREFWETIRMNRVCQPDWFLMSVFFPYPGTALHERCVREGILKDDPDLDLERRKPVLKLPGFSKRQVRRRLTWSPLLIYGGFRPLNEILWLVVLSRVFSDKRLIFIYRLYERGVKRLKRALRTLAAG